MVALDLDLPEPDFHRLGEAAAVELIETHDRSRETARHEVDNLFSCGTNRPRIPDESALRRSIPRDSGAERMDRDPGHKTLPERSIAYS